MTERKFLIVGKDGKLRSKLDPHSNGPLARRFFHSPPYIKWQGQPMVRLEKGKDAVGLYSLQGKVYRYDYTLLRDWISLFHHHANYEGKAMLFKSGNPTPVNLDNAEWKSNLDDTAHMLHELHESDMPERLTRPRKTDWMGVLMGLMAGAMIVLVALLASGRLK